MTEQGQEPTEIPDTQVVPGQTAQEQPKTTPTEWTPESAAAEIKALRAEAAKYRKEREAAQKAGEDAEKQRLAEQGEYKKLYEDAQAKAAELTDAVKARDLALLRQQVAIAKRLPDALSDRLRGETREELEADADALLAVMPTKPTAPNLDGGAGGNRGVAPVTDEEVTAFAQRMGIDPRYVDRAALAKMAKR
jgi:hypothetical protein